MSQSLLSPYRVLDLTDQKGLLCGKILASLGADVIKIEQPGGDPARNTGPFYHDMADSNKSLYWFAHNVNKRGITLDIETADGQRIFKKLVKTADVLIESYPPGHMDRLGLGYGALSEVAPRMIMTSITPFGQSGPYKGFKGADIVLWAMGGMAYLTGEPDRAPLQLGVPQAYANGGLHAAMGTLIALYHRELSGEGQHVDVSIQQAMLLTTELASEIWQTLSRNVTRGVRRETRRCKDGFVSLVAMGGSAGLIAAMRKLTKLMEREGIAGKLKDYDWETYNAATMTAEERQTLDDAIDRFLLTKTKLELYEWALKEQVPLAPLNTVEELVRSPQLAARDFWVKIEHPEFGDTITYPGPFNRVSEGQREAWHRAPLVGEHNEEIYAEIGITKEDLVLLKQAGVV